jgi:cell wall-associated NlpC family hydrolase
LTLTGLGPILRAMPKQSTPGTLRTHALACSLAGLLALLVVAPVAATPIDSGDPVAKFLAEKGLLGTGTEPQAVVASIDKLDTPTAAHKTPSSAQGLVQQMRDGASEMVLTAMNFLGVPYKRGGNSEETGFDCSGFTRYIFERSVGLLLPRRADEQASSPGLLAIARDELKPGDLVFFNTLKRTFSHVGIYVGEGKFIHSPRTGSEVRVEDMRVAYWSQRFTGARRAQQVQAASATPAALPAPAKSAPRPSASAYMENN